MTEAESLDVPFVFYAPNRTPARSGPPAISIEVFLADCDEFVRLRGTNNSERRDVPGPRLVVRLDDGFATVGETFPSDCDASSSTASTSSSEFEAPSATR